MRRRFRRPRYHLENSCLILLILYYLHLMLEHFQLHITAQSGVDCVPNTR